MPFEAQKHRVLKLPIVMAVGEGGKENGLDNKALALNELIMVILPPQNITKLMFQEFSLSTAFSP